MIRLPTHVRRRRAPQSPHPALQQRTALRCPSWQCQTMWGPSLSSLTARSGRQTNDRRSMVLLKHRFALGNRAQDPTVFVFASLQSNDRVGRIVEKDREALAAADDDAEEVELRRVRFSQGHDLGRLRGWRGAYCRQRRRSTRWREQRTLARLLQ